MWLGGGLLAALAVLTGIVMMMAHRVEPMLRAYIVQGLEDHFHARVELESFHITLRNGLWAEGKGLRIWPPAEVAGVAVPGGPGATVCSADPAGGVSVSCASRITSRGRRFAFRMCI